MAPAHTHAIGVAVYPALFDEISINLLLDEMNFITQQKVSKLLSETVCQYAAVKITFSFCLLLFSIADSRLYKTE